jgi:predicted aldo/keto reductase-like oxidoreductase
MEKRQFGSTGLEVSLIGFGGFHLLEIPQEEATVLLNDYLDRGGSYIETAMGYGTGESERKIGNAVSQRRNEFVLVTKTGEREADGCRRSLEESLVNLKTDHVDVLLMHAVSTMEALDMILSPGGAFKEAQKMKAEGKVGHIGLSMHGQPDVLIEALKRAPFEAVMSTINYYDDNNFPKIQKELIPLANEKGVAIILMKPLGDGLLYKNAEEAFNYAFSQPVSVVVTGMNNREMVKMDMDLAEKFKPLTASELGAIKTCAPELGNYVCRQCGLCDNLGPDNFKAREIFRLEGMYDRQMRTGKMGDTAEYALRERLKFWFGTQERAQKEYAALPVKGDIELDPDESKICPFGIDIPYKLHLADYKLANKKNY